MPRTTVEFAKSRLFILFLFSGILAGEAYLSPICRKLCNLIPLCGIFVASYLTLGTLKRA